MSLLSYYPRYPKLRLNRAKRSSPRRLFGEAWHSETGRNRWGVHGVHVQPSGFRSLFRGRQRGHGLHTEAVEFQRSTASPTHQDCCMWGLPFLSSVTASATEAPSHYSVCFHHPNRHCASTACTRNVCRLNS